MTDTPSGIEQREVEACSLRGFLRALKLFGDCFADKPCDLLLASESFDSVDRCQGQPHRRRLNSKRRASHLRGTIRYRFIFQYLHITAIAY